MKLFIMQSSPKLNVAWTKYTVSDICVRE